MSSAPTTTTEPAPAGVAALAALAGVIGLVGAGGYAAVWTLPFEGFLTTGEPADRYTVPLLIVPLAARIAEAGLALAAAWLLARRSAPGARIAVNLLAIVLAWGAVAWAAARIGFLSGQESLRVGQLALSVSSSTWVTVLTAAALLWLTLARRRAATAHEDDEDTAGEDMAGDAGDFEDAGEPAPWAGEVPEGPLPLELAPLWARVRRGRTGAASWLDAPAAEGDPDRATLAAALRLARRALDTDPGQLPAQLIGRLDPDTAPGLAPLLAEAAAWTGSAWLRPLAPALVRPGGPVLATASCAEEDATAVALTADGRTVTGYRNGSIRLGDVWDGSWSGELAGHRAKVNAVAVTPDGRYAVSGSADRGVRLWELGDPGADSGQPDPVLLGRLDDEVTAVALTADARVALAGTSTGALHAWSLEDAAEIGVGAEHTGRVRALAVRSDGAAALSAAEDDAFLAWELDGDRAPFELELDTGVGVTSVAFTADHRLALAGYLDGTLALWDLEAAAKVATFTGHATAVDAVVIAPDGRTGASASLGHTFRLWDLEKARSSGGRAPGAVELAAVSGTGTTALVAAGTGRLELRAADGTLLASDDPHGFDLLAVAVSADGRRAVWGGEDGAVRVWTDLRGVRRLEGHDGMVTAVALGPGGRRALTGDDAPGVLSWDLELGGRPARSDGHEGIVTAVAIAADGRLGASASSDGVIRLWDLEDGTELDKAGLGPGWITALAVCTLGAPAGGDEEEVFVLAGRADGRLLLHDFAAGDGGTVGDGHDGGVTAVVVAPGGRLAASCGADHTIAVHDLRAGTPATGFTADFPFLACAFTELPGGGTGLVAIDASGAAHRLALAGFPGGMRADRPDDEVRAPAR